MARAGRKRKQGKREPNGRTQRQPNEIPQGLLDRRADLVGPERARSHYAGTALGRLYERGLITEAMRLAGESLARSYARWRALAGVPARHQVDRERRASDTDHEWEQIDRARAEYEAMLSACGSERDGGPWRFDRSLAESICLDDADAPAAYGSGPHADFVRERIRTAFGRLARHLRISDRAAA